MSGSEGKQNNQKLSSRAIEEEEMAQELMNMEMYEEGMDYAIMKGILQIINESKNMAGIEPDHRSSQEMPHYSEDIPPEVILKNNSPRELIPEEAVLPKPSFSYRQQSGRASPATSGRKSSPEMAPVEEMSMPSPEMFDTEEPQRFGRETSELIYNKLNENELLSEKDEVNENRSQTVVKNAWHNVTSDGSQSSQSSQNTETNVDDTKSRKNQRVERWKLDPTNAVIDENDVPLRENNRPILKERVPYSFCHNKRVFDASIGDKVITVLTHALEEVADIWRRKHRPDVSEFQWGSPIKVGANNRSLDKKPVIEEASSPKRSEILRINPDSAQRRNMDRNCKRKATEIIRDIVHDQVESDEDSDEIFEKVKKSKKSDNHWQPMNRSIGTNAESKGLMRQEKISNNMQNSNKPKPYTIDEDFDSDELDNNDLSSLRKKNKKKDEEMDHASSPGVFPRRITPPNPSKPRGGGRGGRSRKNGEKAKRKSPVRKNTQALLEKNKNSVVTMGKGKIRNPLAKQTNIKTLILNDDEISNELEKDESEEIDQIDLEIKPMPVKGLAIKAQHGAARLLEIKKAEERQEEVKQQERLAAEKKATMIKADVQLSRFLKEQEEKKEKEAKDLAIKQKEEIWKRNEATRDRDRRRRQALEKKHSEEAGKGLLLMEDDDDDDDASIIRSIDARQRNLEDRVQCPICLLEFSQADIQDHAADCNQFDNLGIPGRSESPDNNDELIITNENSLFDCNICSKYTTSNGIDYEQHLNDCMRRKANASDSTRDTVEAPTSPINCFVPISEQTDSTINYAEQFRGQTAKPNIQKMKRRW